MLEKEMVSLSRIAQIFAQNSELLSKLNSAQQNGSYNTVMETQNIAHLLEAEKEEIMLESTPFKEGSISAFEHQFKDATEMQKTDEDPRGAMNTTDNVKISNKVEHELTTRTKALRSRLEKLTNGD
jgi:hypothetical protein